MKHLFKKLIKGLVIGAACIGLTASAAERKLHSFLGVPAIIITNTASITNLDVATYGTNFIGNFFTNYNGVLVNVGTTTNANGTLHGVTTPLLGTVPLSPLTVPVHPAIDAAPYTNHMGEADIVIKGVGQSGANTAMTLRFTPVFGSNASTEAAERFTWGVTPNTTTAFVIRTNIPLFRMMRGATGIRCDWIIAGDTDASSAVTITDLDIIQTW